MTDRFQTTLYAGWGDIDLNGHMFNAAYLAKAVDCRMRFFTVHGFPAERLLELAVGPVVMTDELRYFKEFRMMEPVIVTLENGGMSEDGSRFRVRNELFKEDGTLAARVTSVVGWLDLNKRKLTLPPEGLHKALLSLSKTEDYEDLPSSVRKKG
ncbi:MAG: thioesterase family protein [Acidobacteriota bacterium]|nr:MAG: thioesterase family protein [Acidobacteriota bacterium]